MAIKKIFLLVCCEYNTIACFSDEVTIFPIQQRRTQNMFFFSDSHTKIFYFSVKSLKAQTKTKLHGDEWDKRSTPMLRSRLYSPKSLMLATLLSKASTEGQCSVSPSLPFDSWSIHILFIPNVVLEFSIPARWHRSRTHSHSFFSNSSTISAIGLLFCSFLVAGEQYCKTPPPMVQRGIA